jgi:hypothetical protein
MVVLQQPDVYEKGKLYELNISNVQPVPEQPRKYFDPRCAKFCDRSSCHRLPRLILLIEFIGGLPG